MTGFSDLALAAQRLENVLSTAEVGMVPCSEGFQFDSFVEKWENEICDKLKEIRLLNSKALLVKASLQKDSIPDSDSSDTSLMGDLYGSVGNSLRWRRVLKSLAMSRAARELYDDRENRRHECQIIDDLSARLFQQQKKLDLLNDTEIQRRLELSKAQKEWEKCTEEYAINSGINYMEGAKRKEDPPPEGLNTMIRKIEIMQMISTKLLTSSHKYDWVHDPKGFIRILQKLRQEKITLDTFV